MKIAILSRNSKLYSTQRLVEAARDRGHVVRILDPLRCYMKIAPGKFELSYKGRSLSGFDAVIPRIGASITRYGTAVLRQFELMGAYTPNGSDAILRARDKLRCHQVLAGQGIDLPVTVFGDNPDDTADLLNKLGKPPHVIKLNEGAQGAGVILTERISGVPLAVIRTPYVERIGTTIGPLARLMFDIRSGCPACHPISFTSPSNTAIDSITSSSGSCGSIARSPTSIML